MVAPIGRRVLADSLNFAESTGTGRRLQGSGEDFAYEIGNASPFLLRAGSERVVLPGFASSIDLIPSCYPPAALRRY